MLAAYIDESGLNQRATAMTVAGLIGPDINWLEVEPLWLARMAATGIATFHAQPCRRGHKEFKGMDESARAELYRDLADIVSRFSFQPVSGSVILQDWRDVEADSTFRERYPTPYSFCFDLCLSTINTIAERADDKVAVTYAINDQYASRAKLVAETFVASKRYMPRIVSCAPDRPQKIVPLQIADMLTYEVYHQWQVVTQKGSANFDLIERLKPDHLGHFYDLDALKTLILAGPTGHVD